VLAKSAYWWNTHALKYLIEQRTDVDIKDNYGQTPLHFAIYYKRGLESAEILLCNGANPNTLYSDESAYLNKAASDTAMVRLLVKMEQTSRLEEVIYFDDIEATDLSTIELLIELDTDLNIRPVPEDGGMEMGLNHAVFL